MKKSNQLDKRQLVYGLVCFLFGVIWLLAVRFATMSHGDIHDHYHANFAVYINGERELFDNFIFYEEVQACTGDSLNDPKTRVHMHNSINHVVHVHDTAATWGHFFANLGFGLGSNYIKTDKGVFVDGASGKKLSIILNDASDGSVYNSTVQNEDKLLISYGNETEAELETQYQSIGQDADVYNEGTDPSSCSSGNTFSRSERFKKTIRFWQ